MHKRKWNGNASKFELSGATLYSRIRLGNNCTVHIIGEQHHMQHESCKPPRRYNIPCLLDELVRMSTLSKSQLDVYIERRASQLHPKSTQGVLEKTLHKTLHKFKNTIPLAPNARIEARLPHARVHVSDVRDVVHHPFLTWLYLQDEHLLPNYTSRKQLQNIINKVKSLQPYKPRKFWNLVPPNARRVLNAVVKSDKYTRNVDKSVLNSYRGEIHKVANRNVPTNHRRNATTFEGRDVSRLRKQVLKLGHGLDDAMLRIFDMLYHTRYPFVTVLITDMYALARMLYYAGYGKQQVASPSKVAVLYGGETHGLNQVVLLHVLDHWTGGKLGVVEEHFVEDMEAEEDGFVDIVNYRSGF